MAELQSYFYSASPDGVWVHHYGGNEFSCLLAPGAALVLEQRTDYPWDGDIAIAVREAPSAESFIKVRIPEWALGATVSVNGKPVEADVQAGRYVTLKRVWSRGDAIEIALPMSVRLMQARPRAEQLRNQVAVMRGPILYCLESSDLPDEADLSNVLVPSDIELQPVAAEDLPFGIQALEGEGLYRREAAWGTELYRPLDTLPLEPIPLRLIPYFAWANRGPAEMSVWLPVVFRP